MFEMSLYAQKMLWCCKKIIWYYFFT